MKACYFLLLSALSLSFLSGGHRPESDRPLSDEALVASFADPSAQWRGKPFWSWNGVLEKEELLRQVGVFRDMGFGGYFMHSRVGLDTEYLGEEWFDLVNAVSDEGVRLGMENYLYDEDRWPSGTAGGYVTMDPAFRIHFMTLEILPKDERLSLPDTLAAVFTCRLEGTSYTDLKRVSSVQEALSSPGNAVLAFHIEEAQKDNFYNGYTYLDPMNRKATDRFISLTHEAYLKHCGKRIGSDIVGIFTDEPHRGMSFSSFGGFGTMKAAWTEALPALYRKRFGADIFEDLPRLFLHRDGAVYDPVKWRWCELTQELFLKNFVKPQSDWCSRHGIAYTGHYLHEDNLTSQVVNQGSLMRAYELQHIPGIDALTQYNRDYWIGGQVRSVARQTGRKHILSELYGCSGWHMSFADYKEAGDWQALMGINLRCPHLSWYTMKGEAKRDYPASISFQSAWYKDFKYVEDYYARLGLLLSQGKPVCDLLVISPVESVFAQVAVDVFDGLNPATEELSGIERRYTDLFGWIEGAHFDFDYGDEDILSRRARIEKAPGGVLLRVGKTAYKTVLVGNMKTMRTSTLALLKRFARKGGKIILAGEAPSMLDVLPSEAPGDFLKAGALCVPYSEEGVRRALSSLCRAVAEVKDASHADEPRVFCQCREEPGRRTYVFMNMTGEPLPGVSMYLGAEGHLSVWDARTGEVEDRGMTAGPIVRDFAPWQEYVFMVSDRPVGHPAGPAMPDTPFEPFREGPEGMAYALDEPNVLPLDLAFWKAEGLEGTGLEEVLKIDGAIRRHFGLEQRGGSMLQPWFFHKFFDASKPSFGPVELSFPFLVERLPSGGMTLCLESPEDFTLLLNGSLLAPARDGWWIDPCYKKVPLPPELLREGENEILLRMEDFTEDKNIESMYLTGQFGVGFQGERPVVTALPDRLHIGDLASQGLPFYSGTVSYLLGPSPCRTVCVDAFGGACVRVRRGTEQRLIAFAPYEAQVPPGTDPLWLDVVLTRRNTFGPLHALPAKTMSVSPGNFLTGGPSWTYGYVLLPSGLLGAPCLK